MKTYWTGQTRLTVILLAMVLVLASAAYVEWDWGQRLERRIMQINKTPATHISAIKILPDFMLPPVDSGYPEQITRPLFLATRRAPAVANQDGNSGMKKGQFILKGVTILGERRFALLRDAGTGKPERLEEGKETRGMTLQKVEPNRVIFTQGDDHEELILAVERSQKQATIVVPPNAAPMAAPAPGQPGQPSPPGAPSAITLPGVTPEGMAEINKKRASHGLPPL